MNKSERQGSLERLVHIKLGPVVLEGNLSVPAGAQAIVLFVHGSGSGRFSPRNQSVARFLREGGLATLLFDLLTAEEETVDLRTRHLRFDIDLLADRVTGATEWLRQQPEMADHGLGYFGASTGAAAALIAATRFPGVVKAVVSRGGRPDLAQRVLPHVEAATLFIVHPDREIGNYVPTVLPQRYDAFLFIDESQALHPLHIQPQAMAPPDTYPWGV